ncbi:flagellar motor switch protein FliG, partial [Acinetobacter baumannii]
PKEVQKLGAAMSALRNVSFEEINEVLEAFVAETGQASSLGLDSDEYIRSVLTKALGDDKATSLLNRILGGRDASGIESLKW